MYLKKKKEFNLTPYNYYILNKFINSLIISGKKSKALKIFLETSFNLKKETKEPFEISLQKALKQIRPIIYFTKIKKSRRMYYLPKYISIEQEFKLSLFWIKKSIQTNYKNKVNQSLKIELLNSIKGDSYSIQKKNQLYNLIESNRPFFYLLKKKKNL